MTSLRDNLLVTAGARAAYMDSKDDIELPGGVEGEDILAEFITDMVDCYINLDSDILGPFDTYIETVLFNKFGGDK